LPRSAIAAAIAIGVMIIWALAINLKLNNLVAALKGPVTA